MEDSEAEVSLFLEVKCFNGCQGHLRIVQISAFLYVVYVPLVIHEII